MMSCYPPLPQIVRSPVRPTPTTNVVHSRRLSRKGVAAGSVDNLLGTCSFATPSNTPSVFLSSPSIAEPDPSCYSDSELPQQRQHGKEKPGGGTGARATGRTLGRRPSRRSQNTRYVDEKAIVSYRQVWIDGFDPQGKVVVRPLAFKPVTSHRVDIHSPTDGKTDGELSPPPLPSRSNKLPPPPPPRGLQTGVAPTSPPPQPTSSNYSDHMDLIATNQLPSLESMSNYSNYSSINQQPDITQTHDAMFHTRDTFPSHPDIVSSLYHHYPISSNQQTNCLPYITPPPSYFKNLTSSSMEAKPRVVSTSKYPCPAPQYSLNNTQIGEGRASKVEWHALQSSLSSVTATSTLSSLASEHSGFKDQHTAAAAAASPHNTSTSSDSGVGGQGSNERMSRVMVSNGAHDTPSPSDSGVGDGGHDGEARLLRERMERNEMVMVQVYEEKEKRWRDEMDKMREEVENMNREVERMSGEVEKVRDVGKKAEEREKELAALNSDMAHEKKRLKQEYDRMYTEHQNTRQLLTTTERELEGWRQQLEETRWNVCQKTGEISLLKSQLRDSATDSSSKRSEALALRVQIRELRSESASRDARNKELVDTVGELQEIVYRGREERRESEIERETEKKLFEEERTTWQEDRNRWKEERQKWEEQIKGFDEERKRWDDEKAKVVRYQQQLQLNYVQVFRKNRLLEAEVDQLTLELESRDVKYIGLQASESQC